LFTAETQSSQRNIFKFFVERARLNGGMTDLISPLRKSDQEKKSLRPLRLCGEMNNSIRGYYAIFD
jgi:hypothetical protein